MSHRFIHRRAQFVSRLATKSKHFSQAISDSLIFIERRQSYCDPSIEGMPFKQILQCELLYVILKLGPSLGHVDFDHLAVKEDISLLICTVDAVKVYRQRVWTMTSDAL